MNKIILCNLDLLKPSFYNNTPYTLEDFTKFIDILCNDTKNKIVFFSRDNDLLQHASDHFKNKNYHFVNRNAISNFLSRNPDINNKIIIIGGKDVDFQLAVNSQLLFIVPTWISFEKKSIYYGIHVDTPAQLYKLIQILNNQQNWYAQLEIEPNITVLSLMDGRYKYHAKTKNEKEMIEHFEKLLKQGSNHNYYDVLLYHFLAGITNTNLFNDIELFGMIPSSDCSLNKDIFSFMTQVRYIKKKRLPKNNMQDDNLIQRVKPKLKAHTLTNQSARTDMGATYEFDTIRINPEFKTKIEDLKNKQRLNICIFDDYMTHGNTFNAVRNLLKSLGANKIIFVSLGNFSHPFQKKDYIINGDVYKLGYTYKLVKSTQQNLTYNYAAKNEINKLYNIFNS